MNSGWREPRGQWARLRPKQPDGPVRGEAGRNQTPSCAAVPPPARGLTGQMLRVSVADFHSARYWRSEALEERDGRRFVAGWLRTSGRGRNEAAGIDHGGATLAISPRSRRGEAVRAYPHHSVVRHASVNYRLAHIGHQYVWGYLAALCVTTARAFSFDRIRMAPESRPLTRTQQEHTMPVCFLKLRHWNGRSCPKLLPIPLPHPAPCCFPESESRNRNHLLQISSRLACARRTDASPRETPATRAASHAASVISGGAFPISLHAP